MMKPIIFISISNLRTLFILCYRYPFLASLMFNARVNAFIAFLQNSDYPPLKYKVKEVFVRIEFQRCGFPHAHLLLWVENPPDLLSEKGRMEALKW